MGGNISSRRSGRKDISDDASLDDEDFTLEPPSAEIGAEMYGDEEERESLKEALEGELIGDNSIAEDRGYRLINRSFSLAEYSDAFSKMQWLLFIEIYDVVKDFYLDKNETDVESFTMENITIRVPVRRLDRKLFDPSNRSRQLREAAEGLMDMRVRNYIGDDETQMGFDFISMFPRIRYNPKEDRDHIYVKIQSEIYNEMVPIESYAQLELKLMDELATGNAQRLYAIFKSYAFKRKFTLTFTDLRKKMGYFTTGKYKEWKYFNSQVLKPTVEEMNKYSEHDIALRYKKEKGKEEITFWVTNYTERKNNLKQILDLNEPVKADTRVPNRIQRKYIRSTIKNLSAHIEITNQEEVVSWIISDLISMQRKQGRKFDFKQAINAISKQIKSNVYSEPFAHKHLMEEASATHHIEEVMFDDFLYSEIKRMLKNNDMNGIRHNFTNEELKANQYGHLIPHLPDLERDDDDDFYR